MKGLVGFVVMFMTLSAWAETWLPDVKHMVKPEYPIELRRMGLTGMVQVKVDVNADGTVANPKIVYSTHPLFAGAALKVMGEWRFASRPLTGDNPQQLVVSVPLMFEIERERRAKRTEALQNIATATCLQLNREMSHYLRRDLYMPLAELTLFELTQKHLMDGFFAGKYDNESLALGLFDLSQSMLNVTNICQRRISRKFVDLLPPSVKALLESGGMVIKRE